HACLRHLRHVRVAAAGSPRPARLHDPGGRWRTAAAILRGPVAARRARRRVEYSRISRHLAGTKASSRPVRARPVPLLGWVHDLARAPPAHRPARRPMSDHGGDELEASTDTAGGSRTSSAAATRAADPGGNGTVPAGAARLHSRVIRVERPLELLDAAGEAGFVWCSDGCELAGTGVAAGIPLGT